MLYSFGLILNNTLFDLFFIFIFSLLDPINKLYSLDVPYYNITTQNLDSCIYRQISCICIDSIELQESRIQDILVFIGEFYVLTRFHYVYTRPLIP